MRVPLAGLNSDKQQHHIMHGALVRTACPRRRRAGKRAAELEPPSAMYSGPAALDLIGGLEYGSDYEDDGYVLSSLEAIKDSETPGTAHFLKRLAGRPSCCYHLLQDASKRLKAQMSFHNHHGTGAATHSPAHTCLTEVKTPRHADPSSAGECLGILSFTMLIPPC